MAIKVLLVHVPQFRSDGFMVGMASVGLFGMAALLQDNGVDAEVVHVGIERVLAPEFALDEQARAHDRAVFCFSLHWHYQLFDTIAAIEALKRARPDVPVVVGGFTATFFAREIMERWPSIDYLVRGDGELPLLELVRCLRAGSRPDLRAVPNLLFREVGAIIDNGLSHVCDRQALDALSYGRIDVMRHHELYVRLAEARYVCGARTNFARYTKTFMACTGRGCSVACFYCGGARHAQRSLHGRSHPLLRSRASVLADVRRLAAHKITHLYFNFDPQPHSTYYDELFSAIERDGLSFGVLFSSWGLPLDRQLEKLRSAFGRHVLLMLSPDHASDETRRKFRPFWFSNENLARTLDRVGDRLPGAQVFCYFLLGAPGDTEADVRATFRTMSELRERYPFVRCVHNVPHVEPSSALHLTPERFDAIVHRRTLDDFYESSRATSEAAVPGEIPLERQAGWRSNTLASERLAALIAEYEAQVVVADPPGTGEASHRAEMDATYALASGWSIQEYLYPTGGARLAVYRAARRVRSGMTLELAPLDSSILRTLSRGPSTGEALAREFEGGTAREALSRSLARLLNHGLLTVPFGVAIDRDGVPAGPGSTRAT